MLKLHFILYSFKKPSPGSTCSL